MNAYLSIPRLRTLTGALLRDGARVFHTTYEEIYSAGVGAGRSIEQRDREASSALHVAMKVRGMAYFRSTGHRIFPRQIGLWGHQSIYRFSDFAVERHRRVRLVECLTPWSVNREKIEKKLQLDAFAPVDFICTRAVVRKFRRWRYTVVATLGKFDGSEIVYLQKRPISRHSQRR